MPGGNKRSYILQKIFNEEIQVFLSMFYVPIWVLLIFGAHPFSRNNFPQIQPSVLCLEVLQRMLHKQMKKHTYLQKKRQHIFDKLRLVKHTTSVGACAGDAIIQVGEVTIRARQNFDATSSLTNFVINIYWCLFTKYLR